MQCTAYAYKSLLVATCILCLVYLSYINNATGTAEPAPAVATAGTKHILWWTGSRAYFGSEGSEAFEGCEHTNCFLTGDKDLLPVEQYAAILFYTATSANHPEETLPARRGRGQRYVFANFEAPIRFRGQNSQYVLNGFYNWTMTYRFDSDVVKRHGFVVKGERRYKAPTKEQVRNKTGVVAWIVSNCRSTNERERLAKKLAKYVPVDVYGACGTLKCPEDEDCYAFVARNYLFYLSFENSHCRDYTTEKFFKALKKDIVPVVYGGGNYRELAPPRSFIDVEDFPSIELLGSYLNLLRQDLDGYLAYFEWKKDYWVQQGGRKAVCKLCEMLNDPEQPEKVYEDIVHWWYSDETAQCKSGRKLPRVVWV